MVIYPLSVCCPPLPIKILELTQQKDMDVPFFGKKAEEILTQMLAGKIIKYRTLGFNQIGSTTGWFVLDTSLNNALAECGIKGKR